MLSIGESLFAAEPSLTVLPERAQRGAQTRAADSGDGREGTGSRWQTGGSAGGTGGESTAVPDDAVKAYRQAARKLAATGAGGAEATADPQTEKEITRLKAADVAVRAHEAAHVAAGGGLVRGGATFTYETGPDGQQYAVAGEVQIDVSPVKGDPEATIQKMAIVRAAALAPADPSATDRAVAAAATQQATAARAELTQRAAEPQATERAPAAGEASPTQWGAAARAAYAAVTEPRSEPTFAVAA